MPETTPIEMKNPSKDEVWRGVRSVPDVRRQLDLGIPLARIARSFGVSRQAIYDAMKKEGATPTGDAPTNPEAGVLQQNDDTTPPDSGSKPIKKEAKNA